MELLEIIKALSHENRLRILNLLKHQELCVCELENILDINQSNASRHLSKLKQVAIIEDEQKAQWVYYKINHKLLSEHSFLRNILEEELKSLENYKIDLERLRKYKVSGISCEDLGESRMFD
ncbi:ArsR/SmtB family transcription factor [Natronospora cellulosivora (SeqCode)]